MLHLRKTVGQTPEDETQEDETQEDETPEDDGSAPGLTDRNYQSLAEIRYVLRKFAVFSEKAAAEAGLSAQKHQALLAIKGFAAEGPVHIGDLAERLLIRPNSTVELVNRLADMGLVTRQTDPADKRRVMLSLTDEAESRLDTLSAIHLQELRTIRPGLVALFTRLEEIETELANETLTA